MTVTWIGFLCILYSIGYISAGCIQSSQQADLVFLVDKSGSVGLDNLKYVLNFLSILIDHLDLGPDNVRVGMATFSRRAESLFPLNGYRNKAEIHRKIMTGVNGYSVKGGTHTAEGLNFVKDVMFSHRSYKRPDVPDILIVLTDGRSDDDAKKTKEAIKHIHAANISVFAVGISSHVSAKEINLMASDTAHKRIVRGFHDLVKIQNDLLSSITKDSLIVCRTPNTKLTSVVTTVHTRRTALQTEQNTRQQNLQNIYQTPLAIGHGAAVLSSIKNQRYHQVVSSTKGQKSSMNIQPINSRAVTISSSKKQRQSFTTTAVRSKAITLTFAKKQKPAVTSHAISSKVVTKKQRPVVTTQSANSKVVTRKQRPAVKTNSRSVISRVVTKNNRPAVTTQSANSKVVTRNQRPAVTTQSANSKVVTRNQRPAVTTYSRSVISRAVTKIQRPAVTTYAASSKALTKRQRPAFTTHQTVTLTSSKKQRPASTVNVFNSNQKQTINKRFTFISISKQGEKRLTTESTTITFSAMKNGLPKIYDNTKVSDKSIPEEKLEKFCRPLWLISAEWTVITLSCVVMIGAICCCTKKHFVSVGYRQEEEDENIKVPDYCQPAVRKWPNVDK